MKHNYNGYYTYKKQCLTCKKSFQGEQIDKYCSRKCFYQSHKKRMKGKNNPNYKHGKTGTSENWFRKRLKTIYGITPEEKEQLFISQNKKCAICNNEMKLTGKLGAYIDHNHSNGKIRGLLCVNCNCALGHFKDDILILEKAIQYLRRFKDEG